MLKRAWLLVTVLLLTLLCLLWWILLRPLTEPYVLAETLAEYVEETSDYEMRADTAIWRFSSPFRVFLPRVLLTEASRPEWTMFVAELTLELHPSALLSLSPRFELNSMSFTNIRLHSSARHNASDLNAYQGLKGEIHKVVDDFGKRVWQLKFEGQDIEAQPIVEFLGADFELNTRLDVRGAMTASGSDAETIAESLSGEVSLTGGPGRLDARGVRSLHRGVVRWARDSGHFVDWPDLMAFSQLEAKFEVVRGFDDTHFDFAFENLSLRGVGGLDFFDQEIDYRFELLIDSSEGQGTFQAGEFVADVPWPIRCRGSFETRLPCGLDQDALADLALQLIRRDAKDRLSRTFGEVFQELEGEFRD